MSKNGVLFIDHDVQAAHKDDEVILELKSILKECDDGSLNSIKCLTLILNKLKDWRRHESLLLWGLKVITNQINQT